MTSDALSYSDLRTLRYPQDWERTCVVLRARCLLMAGLRLPVDTRSQLMVASLRARSLLEFLRGVLQAQELPVHDHGCNILAAGP